MKLPTSTAFLATTTLLASTAASATVRTVYQFADGATWIENVAARPNGNLLLTLLSPSAELHELVLENGILPSSAEARLVHRFDAYEGALGVAETAAPDVFAVVAGNYTPGGAPAWSLWQADFAAGDGAAVAELVPDVPGAKLLNGLTALADGALLVSDSVAGRVLRVDDGDASGGGTPPDVGVFLADDDTTAPPPNATLGVNGVRYRAEDGFLYFTNTDRELFCRVRVGDGDAAAAAAATVEVLAEGGGIKGDDFAVRWEDGEGAVVAYVADGTAGELVRVVVGGGKETLVSGEAPTSAVFGRGLGDGDVLYVVTRDGKVLAVDVGGS